MATPRYPTKQYLAGDFVISAGCVLFRHISNTKTAAPASAPVHPSTGNSSSSNKHQSLQICILHHLNRDEWLLPKGRQDQGESASTTALRETYEETGYPCSLWPQRMPTRAPAPGVDSGQGSHVVDGLTEPMAVTIRELGGGIRRGAGTGTGGGTTASTAKATAIKIIYWYIALVKDGQAGEKVHGTQMANENFESVFMDAEEAVRKMTFDSDRDVVKKALEIVRGA